MSVKDKEHQGGHDEYKPLSATLLKRDLHLQKASHLLLFSGISSTDLCHMCFKRQNRLQQPRLTSRGHTQWNWVLMEHSRGYFTEGREQRTKSSSHPGDELLEDTLKIQLIKMFTSSTSLKRKLHTPQHFPFRQKPILEVFNHTFKTVPLATKSKGLKFARMYKPLPQHPLMVSNHIKHRLHHSKKLIPKNQAVRKEISFAQR